MFESTVRILLVEDNPGDARLLREALRDAEGLPCAVTHVECLDDAIQRLRTASFDVLLLDLSLPDSEGAQTIRQMTAAAPDIPVLVLTGTDDVAMGTESVRCGAQDYLVKGQTDSRLLTRAIRYAIERKRAEREREAAIEFLALVHASPGLHDLIEASVRFFRKQSGCEAVGIRLRDGDDFPYYETRGFPEQFVRLESSLCVRSEDGEVQRDSAGNPVMACMCGNVISGRFDPTKPFFTAQGSFWANETTRLLATTTDADRQVRARNRCNAEGYESVALVALRVGEERLGLLQFNDHRKGMFTPESIALWERLAGYLAVALAQAMAKEDLRQSEERFRSIADCTPVIMWMTDIPGHLEFVNREYREFFGVTLEQVSGPGRWQPVLHPDDAEEYVNAFAEALRTRSTFRAQARVRRADGEWRWIESYGAPRFSHDGRFLGVAGSSPDITIRKAAEDALRESEEQLRVAAQAAGIGMWSWKPGTSDVTVSVNWRRLFGVDDAALVTLETWRDALHPDDRERALSELKAANDERREFNVEYRVLRPDGTIRWITDRGRTWYDDSGRPIGMAGVNVDITERKRAELDQDLATGVLRILNRGDGGLRELVGEVLRLIRESTEFDAVGLRLREGEDFPYYQQDGFSDAFLREENFLCERKGDGAIVRGADGKVTLECTCGLVIGGKTDPSMPCFTEGGSFWTDRATDLLALPPEMDTRVNPRNRCIHAGYQSVALVPVRSGEQIIGLLQLNDRRPQRLTLDRIRFFEGLCRNIGMALERKQTEEALAEAKRSAEQAKAAAEQASKAKDHFLAVLSHELRNPLNPVLATASMLRDDPRFDADTREQLEVICRNAELEARLIDDLLDVTRIERGKVELDRRPVELGTIIRRAAEVCLPDIEARNLEFAIDMGPDLYWLQADAARLQQVFWNLIRNAIKFTPVDGCVGIRCRLVDGHVVAEVIDSGEGIDPANLGRLFNAFEQVERSVTRQFGGLGLGLAISRGLVEMHGGTIHAHSAGKGKGATFAVHLPLMAADAADAAARLTPAATPAKTAPRPLRILLVEDHGDTVRIMCRLLAAEGHEVQTAGDVATAIRLTEQQSFDLMLSDLGLPDGSGLDLMRAIRRRGLTLPGIALSGYGQEQDMQASRKAGFDAHLIKPVNIQRLIEAIARITGASAASPVLSEK